MSENQSRGRRRPLDSPPEEQARVKVFKKSKSPVVEDSARPSTSRQSVEHSQKSITKTDDPREASERGRRLRYDIVCTRPADVQKKTGSSGRPIKLKTNYFRLLTSPIWRMYQYHVRFEPEIELKCVRAGILSEFKSNLGGYLFDGMQLFTTTKLPSAVTTFKAKSKRGDLYEITLKLVGEISMTEYQSIQVLNLILRRAMENLKLQLVGRNLYDAIDKIDLREYRLQLWPGYQTSIRQFEREIMVGAEIVHKVMRTETLYDMLHSCMNSSNYQEDFRRQVLGLTVLTDYNNKTYRINDVDFQTNPRHTFPMKDKEISFIDYYYQKYNIRIRDPNQPLLISKSKDRPIAGKSNDIVILIPELCRATGLTDHMRTNFHLMRAMSNVTRMNPEVRVERLRAFNRRLQENAKSATVFKEWNMTLDKNLVEINGRVLEPEFLVFHDKKKITGDDQADWNRVFREVGMFSTPSRGLERWFVIGTNRSVRDLRNFVDALTRAAGGMLMKINRPAEIILNDDRTLTYVQAVEDACRKDPQLIMCFVGNNNMERYSSIKKKACLDLSIPTQVITQRVTANQRNLLSVATKVAIQVNSKLGYAPWMVQLPLSNLMTVGYDMVKSTKDRSRGYGALVATMNLKQNATFYSTVAECSAYDVLANNLWPMMVKALRQYRKEHGNLPSRILFYRDGVGEGTLKQLVDFEVKVLVENLNKEYQNARSEAPPMIGYVVVTKCSNSRFFVDNSNPPPGTVVDDVITLPERYDFYLVSQSVRQGTVSPTGYNVVYSNLRLTPDQLQMLTYKMTHLYYNWSGTIRVPAVCQYAKKLATLVATNLHGIPRNSLEKKLFYL